MVLRPFPYKTNFLRDAAQGYYKEYASMSV